MKTRTRVILTTLLAFALLAAAVGAGLNAVFTVTIVQSSFSTCSASGNEEAERIKRELDAFVGKSTTFLDLGDMREVIAAYPHFRILSLEKSFPSAVRVSLEEREETFAVPYEEGGYAVLDEYGVFLADKEENENRRSGENIVLEGFTLEYGGQTAGEYFAEWMEVFGAFRSALEEVRANVVSVKLTVTTYVIFELTMREGVRIEILHPDVKAAEKGAAAVEKYLALGADEDGRNGDENRMYGLITVTHNRETEELVVDYTRRQNVVEGE